jgi:hypothetical protein
VNAYRCCEVAARDSQRETIAAPITSAWRYRDVARWLVPSAILALLPKCPVCLAAYLAVGTGVGLSMSTAAYVRMGLVVICITSLSFLVAKRIARLYVRRSRNVLAPLAVGRLENNGVTAVSDVANRLPRR